MNIQSRRVRKRLCRRENCVSRRRHDGSVSGIVREEEMGTLGKALFENRGYLADCSVLALFVPIRKTERSFNGRA